MDEKQFLLDYAANHDLRVVNARLRLRALWTAYLLRQNLFFDRKSGMNDLWNAAKLISWTDDFDEFQAFMNMSVASSFFPTTGVPLPFISYGGSSLIVSLWMVGILLNISKKKIKKIRNRNV